MLLPSAPHSPSGRSEVSGPQEMGSVQQRPGLPARRQVVAASGSSLSLCHSLKSPFEAVLSGSASTASYRNIHPKAEWNM